MQQTERVPDPARIPVAVLGATGVVGQRFVARLAGHPGFEVVALAASERSAGRPYGEACAWRVPAHVAPQHGGLAERAVESCDPARIEAPVVFSALDAAAAREVEAAFVRAGALVFSNASPGRMRADVPLVVPEVNPEHLDLVRVQREASGAAGALVCNPNCTTAVLAMALAPLHAAFGVEAVHAVSMQALSGAGHPGVASLDAHGNVVPFIEGEEEKVAAELGKLLGRLTEAGGGTRVEALDVPVAAACHRVPVLDGHTLAVSVRLGGGPAPSAVRDVLRAWRPEPQERGLVSAPRPAIHVHAAADRPQPALDVERDGGMSVHVGRVRPCPLFGVRFVVTGHNLERGAAGGSVLNAELAVARGLLE